ncbi:MAG: Gfo/Idh/MocA family oxidoreductase [Fimbriimonadaceae bacterium]|nr:Gfo/Idh/MocA family oxidoreductase [Fimbriimonadaceae bacterium]
MVRVGLVGIGFMGVTHYKSWAEVEGAAITAICETVEKRLSGDWTDIKGNFGDSGGRQDLSHLKRYNNLPALLADPDIDLIDCCLPTKFHADAVCQMLAAGKNVICEKPIALTSADGTRMLAAQRESGTHLMIAHVLRVWPEWLWLKEAVAGGEYGKLLGLNIKRVISEPDWSTMLADPAANGGPLVDLHIHDVNFVLHLLGKPAEVYASGIDMGTWVKYVAATFRYPDGPTVSVQGGMASTAGRPFMHHYEAYFEGATVCFGEASEPAGIDPAQRQSCGQALTVYRPDGTASFPLVDHPAAFVAELSHAAQCVASGTPSQVLDAQAAWDSLRLVELEAESVRTGRVLPVNW